MRLEHEVVVLSFKHCSIVKATIFSVCIVEVQVNVNNIKIMNITHKCVCDEFISPLRHSVFRSSPEVPDIWPSLNKYEVSRDRFSSKASASIKLYRNQSGWNISTVCEQTDMTKLKNAFRKEAKAPETAYPLKRQESTSGMKP